MSDDTMKPGYPSALLMFVDETGAAKYVSPENPLPGGGGGGGGGAVTVAQLPATLGPKTAATSLSIAPAVDAVFEVSDNAVSTYTHEIATDTGNMLAALSAILANQTNGTQTFAAAQYFFESSSPLPAGATFGGGVRASGASPSRFKNFNVQVCSDIQVTVFIRASMSGTDPWFVVTPVTVITPGQGNTVTTSVTAPYYQAVVQNGSGSAQASFLVNSSFTA